MSPLLYAQRRDGNETEIVSAWRHAGAMVLYMDKSAGFDDIVIFCGRVYLIEVKKIGEKLTPREKRLAEMLLAAGAPYFIVHDVDEGLRTIGAIW